MIHLNYNIHNFLPVELNIIVKTIDPSLNSRFKIYTTLQLLSNVYIFYYDFKKTIIIMCSFDSLDSD